MFTKWPLPPTPVCDWLSFWQISHKVARFFIQVFHTYRIWGYYIRGAGLLACEESKRRSHVNTQLKRLCF